MTVFLSAVIVYSRADPPPVPQAGDTLTFGVLPYLSTQKMEQVFSPIAARFGALTGRSVMLRSRPDSPRFREQVKQASYDIIFIQPFDYIRVGAANGYIPAARWVAGDDPHDRGYMRAIFVTRVDSMVKRIEDLRDAAVAVPHEEDAASLLGRNALRKHRVAVRIQVAGNHLACLHQVQVRRAAACISTHPTVTLYEAQHDTLLRRLDTTQAIPSSLFAIHRRVALSHRNLIRAELLSWHPGNPSAQAYLAGGGWARLYPATDADYDVARTIWAHTRRAER